MVTLPLTIRCGLITGILCVSNVGVVVDEAVVGVVLAEELFVSGVD